MKVLIVGAGVGGLTLMGCLKKRGLEDITIIEKAPAFQHAGFLIGLWANGRMVMKYLEINHITERDGYEVDEDVFFDKNGKFLRKIDIVVSKKVDPTITIARADLHEGLMSLVGDTDVRFNTTLESTDQNKGKVEAVFSDGESEVFDLVVGADGIHSEVREKVFGTNFLSSYGWGVWAYWLPDSIQSPKKPTAWFGDNKGCFVLPGKSASTVTFISHISRKAKELDVEDHGGHIRELFGDFKDTPSEILKCLPPNSDIWHDELEYVDMNKWFKDRVVLIGDAQHAVSPVVGMGSSMAMEDAYVLAEELASNKDNIEKALSEFSDRRRKRMKKFLKVVRRMDNWMRSTGMKAKFRDFVFPFAPDSYFTGAFSKILESEV